MFGIRLTNLTLSHTKSGRPQAQICNPSIMSYSRLLRRACAKFHEHFDSLKHAIVKTEAELGMEIVSFTIYNGHRRLQSCVCARGDHFE